MNLLHIEDLLKKSHFCTILVFNYFTKEHFLNFIQSIIDCKSLIAELGAGDYEENFGSPIYIFEQNFEEETITIPYEEVLYYAKITLQRFIDNYADNNEKDIAKEMLTYIEQS